MRCAGGSGGGVRRKREATTRRVGLASVIGCAVLVALVAVGQAQAQEGAAGDEVQAEGAREPRVHRAGGGSGLEGLEDLAAAFADLGVGADDGGRRPQQQRRRRKKRRSSHQGAQPRCKYQMPVALDDLPKGYLSANGCGPSGMEVKEPYGLWRCCNSHDVCYTLCNTGHRYCEKRFTKCMERICYAQKDEPTKGECLGQARSFTAMTGMFGRGFYDSAQQTVCACAGSREEQLAGYRKFLSPMFPGEDGEARIEELLTKYKSKLHKLLIKAVEQHGAHLVAKTGSVPVEFPAPRKKKQKEPKQPSAEL